MNRTGEFSPVRDMALLEQTIVFQMFVIMEQEKVINELRDELGMPPLSKNLFSATMQ